MTLEVWDSARDVKNLFITPEIRSRIMHFEPHQLSAGHTHDVGHEMFLVLAGQAEFTIDGNTAVLGPGQACVARAGQWHELRAVGDGPMTLYLSVTPHVEPTHTQWDHEGGRQLPYHYGGATRSERETDVVPPVAALLDEHLVACSNLAEVAQNNLSAQRAAASELRTALAASDSEAAHAAVDSMWSAYRTMYASLQASLRTWNALAPAAAGDLQ